MPLSTGEYHKRVPRDPLQNALFRLGILRGARKNKAIQAPLLKWCKEDILFWINTFGFQANPDKQQKGPFVCHPFQEVALLGGEMPIGGVLRKQWGILECIFDRKDLRMPKSRYIGATWIAAFACVWLGLFHDNVDGIIMSKDEETAEEAKARLAALRSGPAPS